MGSVNVHNIVAHLPNVYASLYMLTVLPFYMNVCRWQHWVFLYYNKPTRCSCLQSILFHCRVTLHVTGAFHTHHQEYIKLYLQPPVQVILWLQLASSNMAKFGLGHVGRM